METNLCDLKSDIEKCMKDQIEDYIREKDSNIKDVKVTLINSFKKDTDSKDSYSFDATAELIKKNSPSKFCVINGTVEIKLEAEIKVSKIIL